MSRSLLVVLSFAMSSPALAQPFGWNAGPAKVVHTNGPAEPLTPPTNRDRARALWSERATDPDQARIVPVERTLSPVQQAAKMRQEKHWNDLTPAEQAKRKAAFQKKHLEK